jgi:hypothetical protein
MVAPLVDFQPDDDIPAGYSRAAKPTEVVMRAKRAVFRR